MNTVLVDDEWLAVTLPEGFVQMPHEEIESMMGFKYEQLRGMRDTSRHMLMSVTWKDSGKFLSKLAAPKVIIKQVDKNFARRGRKSGYRSEGFLTREVAGASSQAHGFRFSYAADGVAQEGEVWVFKRDVRCYTICYYTSSAEAAANRPVWEGIMSSLEVR